MWGRGAFDNKGLAITQLTAIEQFIHISQCQSLPYNVTLLCVSGEETGGITGSALVAKDFKMNFNPLVVIGEGGSGMNKIAFLNDGKTYFAISITEKTFIWLELKCHFMAPGHSSIAGKESANTHMIKALAKLAYKSPKIQSTPEVRLMFSSFGHKIGGVKGYLVQHINWTLFNPVLKYFSSKNPELESILCNTITISSIGNQNLNPNRTIQEAVAVLDCRMLPGTTPEEMIDYIKRTINDPLIEIHELRRGAPQYTTCPEKFFWYLSESIQSVYPNACVIPMLFPASSDNSYYRSTGCPVYGINPMIVSTDQIASVHNYDEYIDFDDMEKGTAVFTIFLSKLLLDTGETGDPANQIIR